MNDKTKKLAGIDDCERPACDDIQSMFQKAAAEANKQKETSKTVQTVKECPAGSSELGRSTWTLMHSMVRRACLYRRR